MRHQGEHFDVGLSRGNFWGFRGGLIFHQKSVECHDIQRKQIKIIVLKIKCTNRYNFAETIPGEAGSNIPKTWEATKRLDRLTPNLAHMCILIWEWIYAKQIEPQDTEGQLIRGVLGGHKSKCLGRLSNGWTDWHQIWYRSVDSSGNGHRLNTICPSTFGEGVGLGVTNSNVTGRCETAGPIGTNFGTHVQIHLGMDICQTNCPKRHTGAFGGVLGGQTFKSQGKLSNGWTLVHVCGFIWEWA